MVYIGDMRFTTRDTYFMPEHVAKSTPFRSAAEITYIQMFSIARSESVDSLRLDAVMTDSKLQDTTGEALPDRPDAGCQHS